MEVNDEDEPNATQEEVEQAETVARYDEILTKCKILRSRLIMTTADASRSGSNQEKTETYDVINTLKMMEEAFHHWSIHEEMLKSVKFSQLALELFTSTPEFEGLDQLLKEHCANQAQIFELAKEIRKEQRVRMDASAQLLAKLCQYMDSLRDDQKVLDSGLASTEGMSPGMKTTLEKQIKEIRFMQIAISRMVANLNIDLRSSPYLQGIIKSVRNPITSLEHFL